jgi:hypothetical protein
MIGNVTIFSSPQERELFNIKAQFFFKLNNQMKKLCAQFFNVVNQNSKGKDFASFIIIFAIIQFQSTLMMIFKS